MGSDSTDSGGTDPDRTDPGGFGVVGTGLTVYEDDQVVEGPTRWLDSPAAVLEFVNSGLAGESVAVVRGGTTTFLAPALTSGVKGVITLQGAPESHLGILSREYGIPCVMSVAFTEGIRTGRGEIVPADGTMVRLDVSSTPKGRVLARPGGAPVPAPNAEQAEGARSGPTEQELAQMQLLLQRYQGEVPHGPDGDRVFRERISTNVLYTGDDDRDLTRLETNEFSTYLGFNLWDCLAMRATEGESGLIPRQEYEAVGFVQIWQRYPEIIRFITDQIGVDGVHQIGATSRTEVGTKANMLHILCVGVGVAFGRGLTMGLGRLDGHEREADLRDSLQFTRRLYRGLWDTAGHPMFSLMQGCRAPILGADWITRFRDEMVAIADPETRLRYQRFSANTELMGFLLHFDNRVGLHDTGPYPTGDGGFIIVRDHFLSDDLYHWGDVAAGLPHAITQAMYFRPQGPLEVSVMDHGTMFTKPANYLKHLVGMAVYARDRWDSPMSELRLLDDAELDRIQAVCRTASTVLYRRIASMRRRDKVMAGAQVYYADFIAPFARAAGLWDRIESELDFFEIDPVASQAYYPLVTGGAAAELVPRLFITGAGFPPVVDAVEPAAAMPALHRIAVRGACRELPGDPSELLRAGLVSDTTVGYLLTEAGTEMHARQLDVERGSLDTDRLTRGYQRFLTLNRSMKTLSARWQNTAEQAREALLDDLADIVERVEPLLRRTTEQLDRFGDYAPRLRAALDRAEQGELDYVVSPLVDSVHTVWMQLHEDYLLTQGISREREGSY